MNKNHFFLGNRRNSRTITPLTSFFSALQKASIFNFYFKKMNWNPNLSTGYVQVPYSGEQLRCMTYDPTN